MLQLAVLDEAARSHPEVWWWVKGDGCDVTSGLQESVDHKWSGDVDLGNGLWFIKLHQDFSSGIAPLCHSLAMIINFANRICHMVSSTL